MAEQFREQGAFSWFELTTTDVRKAESFYTRLFGWTTEPWTGEGGYTLIKVNGKEIGGIVSASTVDEPRPCGWGIYVTVTDVDETAKKVPEYGGKVLVQPTDIPRVGRFCIIEDPLGAVITAITYCRG
ncbi:MAG: glyoxalase [Geobacteraceae bacterium GWC2_58_44]|nr:MAG: glyoxalase [Geobacteraceae bacterium GWC2_58_44]HBG07478.1 VOC family protein [Geobacter sp.]